jgi:hypothetical protein
MAYKRGMFKDLDKALKGLLKALEGLDTTRKSLNKALIRLIHAIMGSKKAQNPKIASS